ncbi:Chromatin assembly factor 1 subunit A-A [Melipona quadrifasciata]|uniref:Chromatin assembly factor 1 subunit A-A n=1 Tax=Melipona quadrifasciata TaxID=166423 RepID=A0A0N0BHQ6_9HYME|nr:Chromatin assembly factor 1 subunit A-A [Melipona quadrifasciata]
MVSSENDCEITSVEKKKLKQAQLPFQMRSSVQSPNVIQSKKRKLSSSSECESPKAIKILKNLSIDNANSEPDNVDTDIENKDIAQTEIIKDTEIENAKENASNKKKAESKSKTPKRISIGQKKLEKSKSSPLTKFFQKTDKQKEESEISLQETDDIVEEIEDSSKKVIEIDVNRSETANSLNDTVENSFSTVHNSSSRSDSDLVILSSDSEDKDEETKSITSTSIANIPRMDEAKRKKLTRKRKEKKLLTAKKREENKLLQMEKRKKLEEERQNRKKEKEEKRKQKEEKERVEREQKLMEKKMKEQKKQMEIEQKQKEKQAKEEERRRKEEEKRKKEEEKLEAERKKQKAATTFTSFFVAKKQEKSVENESTSEMKNFMPFEVKGDMKIAPVCRRLLTEQEKLLLDEKYNEGSIQVIDLYVSELKDKRIVPRKSSKTWPLETKDDVILLEEDNDCSSNIVNQNVIVEKQRPKLLQFSENQRPPYWGTWRKHSKIINPRRPFFKDMLHLRQYLGTYSDAFRVNQEFESFHSLALNIAQLFQFA